MLYRVIDPWERIRYFERVGQIDRLPTAEQLAHAERQVGMTAGPLQRLQDYAARPLTLLSSRANAKRAMDRTQSDLKAGMAMPAATLSEPKRPLERALLFPPARFVANFLISPYYIRPGSGLDTPLEPLIHHLLSQPHTTALWDVQLAQATPGGLDTLRRMIAACRRRDTLRWKTYELLVQRPNYLDYLDELVDRCERFDYPETPQGFTPHFENLVLYLRYAAMLDEDGRPTGPLPLQSAGGARPVEVAS